MRKLSIAVAASLSLAAGVAYADHAPHMKTRAEVRQELAQAKMTSVYNFGNLEPLVISQEIRPAHLYPNQTALNSFGELGYPDGTLPRHETM